MGTAATPVARLKSTLGHGRTPISSVGQTGFRPVRSPEWGRWQTSDLLTVRAVAKPVKFAHGLRMPGGIASVAQHLCLSMSPPGNPTFERVAAQHGRSFGAWMVMHRVWIAVWSNKTSSKAQRGLD